MHLRNKGCLLAALILLSTLICGVWALPSPNASFQGGGITVDFKYPDEAHPNSNITHSVTVTANTNLSSIIMGVLIYAPVNSTLQLLKNQPLGWGALNENENFTTQIPVMLPEQVNGTLYCVISVQTDQTANTLSYGFYTTHVSELTFSEMQIKYDQMLSNYTQLQTAFDALLNDYNSLFVNYTATLDNYTSLISQFNQLQTMYDNKVTAYNSLISSNSQLSQDYSSLNSEYQASLSELAASKSDFESLNSNTTSLRNDYSHLQSVYDTLNQTYYNLLADLNTLQNDLVVSKGSANNSRIFVFIALMAIVALVALIVYLRKKEPEPYVVIRKETVAVEPEENQEPLEED